VYYWQSEYKSASILTEQWKTVVCSKYMPVQLGDTYWRDKLYIKLKIKERLYKRFQRDVVTSYDWLPFNSHDIKIKKYMW
jgi:hypothetical protein